MDNVILHCDLNNFYASVEMLKNPALRGRAIAVCGDPEMRRGIVLAKSEPAKKHGVKTGMPIWQAKQLCPDIIIVSHNHADYNRYSKIVQQIYYRFTDLVEPFGGDECWLDVTKSLNLFGDGKTIADEIRRVLREEVGLTASVGVSWNKTFSKLGSDLKKPDATTIITRDNYKDVVWTLPVSDMLFVGKRTTKALERMNILTIGDLAKADAEILRSHFGINAIKMVAMAKGEDGDPVKDFLHKRQVKSVGNGTTLPSDLTAIQQIDQVIYLLSEEVAYRMRRKGVKGTTVNLSVRDENLLWSGAQETITQATCSCTTIHGAALKIFDKIWAKPRQIIPNDGATNRGNYFQPVHSIRVAVSNLTTTKDTRTQTSFFAESDEAKNDKISSIFDNIRRRYGSQSIMFATGVTGEFNLEIEILDE